MPLSDLRRNMSTGKKNEPGRARDVKPRWEAVRGSGRGGDNVNLLVMSRAYHGGCISGSPTPTPGARPYPPSPGFPSFHTGQA